MRLMGALLAIGHILTFVYWSMQGDLPLKYARTSTPMCWSLMETCEWVRFIPTEILGITFGAYLLFGIISALLLFSTRLVTAGWIFMLLAFSLKTILYLQDFRLSSNIHYFHFILSFLWLFIPNKLNNLRLVIVSYFAASAITKLSPEWLTGTWYLEYLNIPIKLAEWLAALSVLIEFIAPVILFFRDARYFWIAFLTLVSYLGFLIYVDGFLGPSILLLSLLLFVFEFFEQRRLEREFIYQSFIRPEPSKLWVILVVVCFWAGQVLPYLPTQRPVWQHVGKITSLNTMASIEECRQTSFAVYENHIEEIINEEAVNRNADVKCNLYLRFLDIKGLCEDLSGQPGFKTVASFFSVRGLEDKSFHRKFEVKDFCKREFTFKNLDQI